MANPTDIPVAMTQRGAFLRDDDFVPITSLGLTQSKAITYAAATTGAVGATTLFTVTGIVAVRVFGYCGTDLTGSGTVEVGIAGNTAVIIAQSTGTDIDAGDFWVDTGPATVEALPAIQLVAANIIQTIASATITAGVLTYYCEWVPISTNGKVVAA